MKNHSSYRILLGSIILIASYTQAHEIPNNFQAILTHARLLRSQNKTDEAIAYYDKAIALEPYNVVGIFDLAFYYTILEKYDAAIPLYKKILHIMPQATDALINLAHCLRLQGNMNEAIPYFYESANRKKDHAHVHYGLAECYLAIGNFEKGFQEFEWRWHRDGDCRNFTQKYWDGIASLQGKVILIRSEYGHGDAIQFIRYAKFLKEKGARTILEIHQAMHPLFSSCPYIDHLLPICDENQKLPDCDMQVPLMSLPRIFGTTMATIPTPIPYFKASEKLVVMWKEKIKSDVNYKIGICWQSSPYHEQHLNAYSKKSLPLQSFIPLMQIPGISIYSLQKIDGADQINTLPHTAKLYSFGPDFDREHGRFMDTAALIEHLDLVITVDTSIAHLAGALGKKVWMLLPLVPDWRWMINRPDSPWYPSMRLFRQYIQGDWHIVIQKILEELKEELKK